MYTLFSKCLSNNIQLYVMFYEYDDDNDDDNDDIGDNKNDVNHILYLPCLITQFTCCYVLFLFSPVDIYYS